MTDSKNPADDTTLTARQLYDLARANVGREYTVSVATGARKKDGPVLLTIWAEYRRDEKNKMRVVIRVEMEFEGMTFATQGFQKATILAQGPRSH